MTLARFDNIVAMRTDTGRVVGFHARNLQIARLDTAVWQAMRAPELAPTEIKNELLTWNSEVDPTVTDGHPAAGIRTMSINIAQICNMRCTYCAAGGDGTYGSTGSSAAKVAKIDLQLVKDQLKMLLEKVPRGGRFSVNFIGGEPLIDPDAIKQLADHARIIAFARGVRVRFEITTNATLVSRETAALLAEIRAVVTVSLDGPPAVNDAVRKMAGGRGSSALALRGIERLIEVQEQLGALYCNAVFGRHNIDVVGSWQYLRRLPWDAIHLGYAAGPEDATYSPLYAKGLAQVGRLAMEAGGERELRRVAQFDHLFRILEGRQRVHNHCGAGKTLVQVDTQGRFYACNWWVNQKQEELGSGLELSAEAMAKFAPSLIELNNCQSCWARYLCGGGCMFVNRLSSGERHKKDQHFCDRTREIFARGIELYEQARYEGGQGA